MTKIDTKLAGQRRAVAPHRRTSSCAISSPASACCGAACSVEGSEHIPAERHLHPGAHAPQHPRHAHRSGVTRRRMRFMGADKWWSNEWFGKLLSLLGGFPVTRGTADREALKRCIALLEGGEPLVLFPEGERKSGPDRAAAVRRCRLHRGEDRRTHRAGRHRRLRAGDAEGRQVHPPDEAARHRRRAHLGARRRHRRRSSARRCAPAHHPAARGAAAAVRPRPDARQVTDSREPPRNAVRQPHRIAGAAQLACRVHAELRHADVDGVDAEAGGGDADRWWCRTACCCG